MQSPRIFGSPKPPRVGQTEPNRQGRPSLAPPSETAWIFRWMASVLVLSGITGVLSAQQPPSYSKQIRPFFARYCLECHTGDKPKGDLNLETYKTLQEGGKNGPVVVAYKPDDSRLVNLAEGKDKLVMPPKTAKQPRPEEIALLRAWVAAGAKEDAATIAVTIPDIKPRVPSNPPVTSLAYHPNGKIVASGVANEILFIDVADGDIIGELRGHPGKVTSLAFSRDGKTLAAAAGAAGTLGEIRLYSLAPSGLPNEKPRYVIAAHNDVIHDAVFSPDNKILATCSYDRLIKLWDVATGKELRTLKDHSDAVYSLAFSPDGLFLASGAADRAVKIWEVATGSRLYSLGESTDWIYAVAWSPSGHRLAAGGVDKSIRVWEVNPDSGKILQSVFAHEGPISRLAYAQDGKTLYSLSEDRSVKAWESSRMTERKVFPKQPDVVLALAVRPDHQQIALGRYDGRLILLDEAEGKIQSEPLPAKLKPPQVGKITPNTGQRGQTLRLVLDGKNLDQVTEFISPAPGLAGKILSDGKSRNRASVEIVVPGNIPGGVYQLSFKAPAGTSNALPFTVDPFPSIPEQEPNDSPLRGQIIKLPATVIGTISRAGEVDFFRFEAKAQEQVGVQVLAAAIGSKLEPVITLLDATGAVLTQSMDGVLGYTCPKSGVYAVGIRDRDFRGGPQLNYRLSIGDIPVVSSFFPMGLKRGTEAEIQLEGVNLGNTKSVRLKAAADVAPGTRLPLTIQTPYGSPLGNASVVVGEFPEIYPNGNIANIPVPGTANGIIKQAGATQTWRFSAKKGQQLIGEINARRIGSPLDSYIEILDLKGQPVPRATLRCLAKTYTTFRDHDSAGSGIRIESWNELAINDYIWVGSELLRIRALPKNPDDDCQFFSVNGQRRGYLDTTCTHHSMGTPMYKVEIHPPGATFPPNGLPVIGLYYRNDDGGAGYGKDSRLFFDPPAAGEYQVRIGDSRNQGGSNYGYRLTVRPPRPGFNISFNPTNPVVWKGGAIPVTVRADRIDGFEGAIDLRLENVPPGFSAPDTSIPEGENATAFALWADATAMDVAKGLPIKVIARARIDGQEVIREVTGGLPKVKDPGDIVTTLQQSEVIVQPGGQVTVTATIERRNGFKGRVPLDVTGLPHGVRVLDIGLNGILITEKETQRTFVIYAEPWVKPMVHPIVVLARREGKNTEHAARSVLLRVGMK